MIEDVLEALIGEIQERIDYLDRFTTSEYVKGIIDTFNVVISIINKFK